MSDGPTEGKLRSLRIWPAATLLVVLWGIRILPGLLEEVSPQVMMVRFMAPALCCVFILLWWLFLSRASLKEKELGLIGLIAIVALTTTLADKSTLALQKKSAMPPSKDYEGYATRVL
jgi:hypothetical protein